METLHSRIRTYNDHSLRPQNLTYFRTAQKLNRRQARWSLYLLEFAVKLIHMPGTKLIESDALLRRPDRGEGNEQDNRGAHSSTFRPFLGHFWFHFWFIFTANHLQLAVKMNQKWNQKWPKNGYCEPHPPAKPQKWPKNEQKMEHGVLWQNGSVITPLGLQCPRVMCTIRQ